MLKRRFTVFTGRLLTGQSARLQVVIVRVHGEPRREVWTCEARLHVLGVLARSSSLRLDQVAADQAVAAHYRATAVAETLPGPSILTEDSLDPTGFVCDRE